MLPAIGFWLVHGWAFLVVAFLIGSIPFGLLVGRVFFKTDIRSAGSGNIGAANARRTMGRGAGISVLLLDAFKGALATSLPTLSLQCHCIPLVEIFRGWTNAPPAILSGLLAVAAVLGHCYSPWLGFKGGKGVATFLGVLIVVWWPSAITFIIVWLAIVLATGFASAGSILGTIAGIAAIWYAYGSFTLYFSVPAAGVIIWQHRTNIARLLAGNENRLNLLKSGAKPSAPQSGPSGG